MLLTGQGGCDEGVWVHHHTLTSQPQPVPFTLPHAPCTPDISHPLTPLPACNRHSEVERLHRQALELQQRVLGPEHPDTISSINNLAACIQDMGRWAGSDATECGWGGGCLHHLWCVRVS